MTSPSSRVGLLASDVHVDEAHRGSNSGPMQLGPARGEGKAWYVSTELDVIGRRAVVDAVCAAAHVNAPIGATAGVEVVVRRAADVEYVFAINHTHQEGSVAAAGTDLLTGQVRPAPVLIPAGGVVVLRRPQ